MVYCTKMYIYIYIEGSYFKISKIIIFLSLKIVFVSPNCADPDEMPHFAAFHLGFHCLQGYRFRAFWT